VASTLSVARIPELAGAASDTDSEASRPGMPDAGMQESSRKQDVLARIDSSYIEDPDRETGAVSALILRTGRSSGLRSRPRNQRSRVQIPVVSRGFCDE
jgi:hypothetical protein